MAFPLTLLYIAIALLSPGVFPEALSSLHIEVLVGGITLVACFFELQGSGLFERREPYFLVGLLIAAVASIALTGWFGGAYGFLGYFFPTVVPFFFIALSCRSLRRLKILTAVMFAVALYIIFQGAHAQLTADVASPYVICEFCYDDDAARILRSVGLGVLNDPNDLAQLLVALLPLLWLRWKKDSFISNFFLTLLPACLLVAGIFLTHSRGGTVALGAVLIFGLKDKIGLIGSAIMGGLGGVGALALGITGGRGISDDDGDRIGLWFDALQAFKSHFVFGVGANLFPDYNSSQTAHNSYILCLAETGLFGYFFWIGLIVTAWQSLTDRIKASRRTPEKARTTKPSGSFASQYAPAAISKRFFPSATKPAPAEDVTAPKETPAEPKGPRRFQMPSFANAMGEPVPTDADVAHFARVLKVSMVGLLVAAFFISRTYSMPLYIILGMATALHTLASPVKNGPATQLVRKILIVMAVSTIFLYFAIRLGSH